METKLSITKVRKNSEGDITDVMMNNGTAYPIDQAINLVKEHSVEGVNVGQAKNGREFLRSNPDGDKSNNLDQLPTF